jgi:thiamine biosynthesis protein ThiS
MSIILSKRMLVNGKLIEYSENLNLNKLLGDLKINPNTIAIMLNGEILNKSNLEKIQISESDQIELIKFVGGG